MSSPPPVAVHLDHDKSQTAFYVRSVYATFTFIWMLVIVMNKFYTSICAYILLIPFAIFLLGFINADDICDCEVETDVLSITFISVGVILSMPLLTMFNKDGPNRELNKIIFYALICILLSYLHIWVSKDNRHICKAIRSCLETFAISLYIFAITIFFMRV